MTVATILENTDTIGTLVTEAWTVMTGNPLLLVFMAGTLLSMGFAFFRKARRAIHG